MFTSRKRSSALIVVFISAVAVGFYLYIMYSTKHDYEDSAVQVSGVIIARGSNDTKTIGPVKGIGIGNAKVGTTKMSRIDTNFIDLDKMDAKEFLNRMAIVTAISQNHFQESKGMIGSVQEILPYKKIIIYNLGLTPESVKEVKRLCNVELRSFNFSKYPLHVKSLFKYAWKPLIIKDALKEFGVVLYGDASARIQKDPLVLFPILKQQKGFVAHVRQYGSSNILIAHTHPKMFKELQIDMGQFVKEDGFSLLLDGGRLLLANTPLVQSKIIEPWVECAFKEQCIAPAGSVLSLHQNKPNKHTHRYDQAALALIVYKNMRGLLNKDNDQSKVFASVVDITRSTKGTEKAKNCKK